MRPLHYRPHSHPASPGFLAPFDSTPRLLLSLVALSLVGWFGLDVAAFLIQP